ncbi:unnamed protein product [Lampetra fluviatilis]
MAVVIRLQGLPMVAGTMDIRQFFSGLSIPDGGVHIVGGEQGEAFIMFATDEDARLGMMRNGGSIKTSKISLLLSSKSEMQNVIEQSRRRYEVGSSVGGSDPGPGGGRPVGGGGGGGGGGGASSSGYGTGSSSGSGYGANGVRGGRLMSGNDGVGTLSPLPPINADDLYVRLVGLPFWVTRQHVLDFFAGLAVDGVVLGHDGDSFRSTGDGFVKFHRTRDAIEGMKRHQQRMVNKPVEVHPATEREWLCAAKNFGGPEPPQKEAQAGAPAPLLHLPMGRELKRPCSRSPSHSPKKGRSRSPCRDRSPSPNEHELCVQIRGFPLNADKFTVLKFLGRQEIREESLILVPEGGTVKACVECKSDYDMRSILRRDKSYVGNNFLTVRPIQKWFLERLHGEKMKEKGGGEPKKPEPVPSETSMCYYLHLSNIPCSATKDDLMCFFKGHDLSDEGIQILRNKNGETIGQAMLQFRSMEAAGKATSLNRSLIGGREAIIRVVSHAEMLALKANPGMEGKAAGPEKQQESQGPDRKPGAAAAVGPGGFPDRGFFPGGPRPPMTGPPPFCGPNFRGPPPPLPPFMSRPPLFPPGDSAGVFGKNFGGPLGGDRPSGPGMGGVPQPRGIVRLKNLPRVVNQSEILDFFYGYRVIPESVNMQVPGSALVSFETTGEAMAAVKELNERPIGVRKVRLCLV